MRVVWTMGRVGSHSVRDWLRKAHAGEGGTNTCGGAIEQGEPSDAPPSDAPTLSGRIFVVHGVCRSNVHLAPWASGEGEYHEWERGPEGVAAERLETIERLRTGEGVRAVVVVRNPIDRAVSAWRYFGKERGEVRQGGLDKWWEAAERCMGGKEPRTPGVWPGRHDVVVVRIEDGAEGLRERLGVDGGALERKVPSKEGRRPTFGAGEVERLAGSRMGAYYTEREIREAVERWRD